MFTIISLFQKLIKGGVGIRAGGWKIFQRLTSGGGDDYSVLESKGFSSSSLNLALTIYSSALPRLQKER